ncbi:TetR/AcrR family transcriptional regulator [soil metagenome]
MYAFGVAYEPEAVISEGARTRQRILETALELFKAEGFEAASLRQLADRLEFTTAALYYHFGSKADILHGVAAPLLDDLDGLLADLVNDGRSATGRQILEHLIDVLLRHRTIVAMLASDVSASRTTGVRERLAAQNEKLVNAFAGEDRDPERMIRIVAALGAVRRPLMDLPHLDLTKHCDTILDSATAALDPPARGHQPTT